jgi:D-alanyl-D-alanine carboxypeptidase/D-alanyl-D-alanine-endopeptidase (penicillin-binding protein 4)
MGLGSIGSRRRIRRWRRPRRTAGQRAALAGVVLLVLVFLAGVGGGGYLASRDIRRHLDPGPPAPPTPSALISATVAPPTPTQAADGPAANAAAVAAAVRSAVGSSALGGRVLAQVVDAESGAVLYTRDPAVVAAPASTAKIVTAAAVLATRGPDYRIDTTVTASKGTLYLVGGGDPTLTGASGSTKPAYPGAARLADLAQAVTAAKVPVSRIVVVDSAYTGPAVSPDWAPEDVPSDYAAAITAVTMDSAAPDLAAGARLAALLRKPGLPVARGAADPAATEVARVQSPPVSMLVQQMLQPSDNVLAEALARQVAIATHQPPSFTGAAKAIRATLAGLGFDVGPAMVDGSGLAARDRISPSALVAVLRLAVDPTRAPLHPLVAGLPVAGWSGTLTDRYVSGSSTVGAGAVRAKTGTLTGVSSLAGYVHDRGGRLLAFAFIADQVSAAGTAAAEDALDRVAADLAACVCH